MSVLRAAAALAWLGRQGTRAIAAVVLIGIAVPPLGAVLRPFVTPAIFVLLCIAFLRVDAPALRSYVRRPVLVLAATAWTMLAVPLLFGAICLGLGLDTRAPELFLALMLQAVAPPMMAAPAFAALMGFDATLVLASLVTSTALTPLTAPLFAYGLIGPALALSPALLGIKLFAILAGSALVAVIGRRLLGMAAIARRKDEIDGINIIVVFVFVAAVMEHAAANFIRAPAATIALAALAFAVSIAVLAATAAVFAVAGAERAFVLGLMASQRNMGLMLAATGGALPDFVWLYFALCQFPIYLFPQLLKPLARRLAGRAPVAARTPRPRRRAGGIGRGFILSPGPEWLVASSADRVCGMTDITPTKTHHDENFPVASLLIAPRHRATILAFYRFVRAADDVADSAVLSATEKVVRLDRLEAGLLGQEDAGPEASTLRQALAARNLSPRHAQDLLAAFRTDATKLRYRDWNDLIGYCTYSAMPVGRFVLDVHGEDHRTWPASDALCAALQIINHLQDCGKDYRSLDRVYIPLDAMECHGVKLEDLGAERASPALTNCIRDLAARTRDLLHDAAPFSMSVDDLRLALEVAVIHKLAVNLVGRLMRRDPLRERVHHNGAEVAGLAAAAVVAALPRRAARRPARAERKVQDI